MTWGDFKKQVESQDVTDGTLIRYIDVVAVISSRVHVYRVSESEDAAVFIE